MGSIAQKEITANLNWTEKVKPMLYIFRIEIEWKIYIA